MTAIAIESIGKRFAGMKALDGISLELGSGSFTALLGPSGCGKTTLLRLIAGFEAPDEGSIRLDGETVCNSHEQMPPEKRRVGVVFQSYALWPHLSVGENVAYPLKAHRVARDTIGGRVANVLALVGLAGFDDRRPDELSGGQRQRVALARCLVADHRIILFDEPLANLDMHLRAEMIETIRELHQRTRRTMVYVTHDQAEALALADHVAVLQSGRLLQYGTPTNVYRSPANAAVAAFVGRGGMADGVLQGAQAAIAGHALPARSNGSPDGPVRLLLRPEAIALSETGIPARVTRSTYRGPSHEIEATIGGNAGRIVFDHGERLSAGESIHLSIRDAWVVPGA